VPASASDATVPDANVPDATASAGQQPSPAQAAPATPKPKPPAPEEQPFGQFVPGLLIPALSKEISGASGSPVELSFEQGPMPVVGAPCWMVCGALGDGRRFWLCFSSDDINSPKTIALAEGGGNASLLESFLIDEKKTTLALLVSRLLQRLNGQKWLGPN